ncbi:MAG: hypothetical protein RLZZ127_1343, partial [Planctomycetota bacterium]
RVLAAAAALAAACARAVGAEAFAHARRTPVTPADERRLPALAQAAAPAVEALRRTVSDAAVDLGVPAPTGFTAALPLARFAAAAAAAPAAAWWAPAWRDLPAMAAAVAAWDEARTARAACPVALQPGADACTAAELERLRADILAHGGGLFRALSSAWRAAKARLESLVVAPRLDPAGAVAAVDALLRVVQARDRLLDHEPRLREAFAGQWPCDPRPALAWRQGLGPVPEGVWAGSWGPDLARSGAAAGAAADHAAAALAALADLLQGELPDEPWAGTGERLRTLADHPERWADRAAVVDAQAALAAAGAVRAAAVAPGWAGVAALPEALERARAEAVLDAAGSRPALARLDPDAQAALRRRYADLDRAWLARNRRVVALAHHGRLPRAGDPDPGAAVLRREAEKKARHLPLRELVRRAGAALLRTKPVLLMSPAAVAAHLAPGALATDLVVFDEASQVRPVEALGALLRGRQAVVVGDSRQMPPTAFFRHIGADSDGDQDEDAPVSDVESILGLFLAQGAPARMLTWHYRSRHPDLIAVSNARCYEGRLRTFPSPRRDGDLGLGLVPVAGTYERAGSRSNPAEASAVAEAARAHARATPDQSLGIVAFSVAQAQAIEHAVERLRQQDPAFDAFWESDPHEPAFVKNLESVQGDERDAMLISVGYGRDGDGRLAFQFGPLGADGGERRLNVLITRARRRQRIFTGLRPEDLAGATAPGVQMLREFLAACRDGVPATAWSPAPERGLARRLRAAAGRDLAEVPGLGWAADGLGLFDPARLGPGATLRDRERLAPEVLEGLGWRLLRLHPVAWWRRPERESERLRAALAG